MTLATAVNPTFADYTSALRTAFTGAGFTELALLGADEFGMSLGASGHNVALKLTATQVRALPFNGSAAAGSNWDAQPATVPTPTTAGQQVRQRPIASNMTNYWIFSDEPSTGLVAYVHAILEVSPGVFSHFMVGVLNKTGAYVGGQYVTSTYVDDATTSRSEMNMPFIIDGGSARTQWLSHINHPAPAAEGIAIGEDYTETFGDIAYAWADASFGNGEASLVMDLFTAGTIGYNGLLPMAPLYARLQYDVNNDEHYRLMGSAFDVRLVNMKQHTPASTFVLGSDTWYLFPLWKKNATNLPFAPATSGSGDVTDSGAFGLAYREV